MGLLCTQWARAAVQITDVDHYILPPDEIITVTGTDLSNAAQARFVNHGTNFQDRYFASVNSLNSTTAEIRIPDFVEPRAYHTLILETDSSSTVGIGSPLTEHTGNGAAENPYDYGAVVIRSGALLSGEVRFGIVVVETGGVFEMDNNSRATTVYAQDGAVVNVTSVTNSESTIYHSPDTVLIWDSSSYPWDDSNMIELPPITPSYDINRFQQGTPVHVEVVGNGSVDRFPDLEYFLYYGYATLTAVPAPGYMFSGWSGDLSSQEDSIRVHITENAAYVTATFMQGWQLELPNIPGATTNASPELAIYPDGQVVSISASIDPDYDFLGWGGDASGSELNTTIAMEENLQAFPIVRSKLYGELPELQSADQYINAPGETMTVTGANLETTTLARLIYRDSMTEMTVATASPTSTELIMPETPDGRAYAYNLFLETETGSSISIPDNFNSHSSDGPVADYQDTRPLVIRAGGSLTGGSSSELVVVETGGYYRVDEGANLPYFIFAEDGAVIDFRFAPESYRLTLFHSPETVILGSVPMNPDTLSPVAELIPPLRVSHGFDMIQKGRPINLTIIGNGTVQLTPDTRNYAYGTTVSLHAIPMEGATFNGWSGDIISQNEWISYTFGYEPLTLTAQFPTGWQLEVQSIPGITVTRSPALSSYENGQTVSLTATPSSGYYLEGWAGDVSGNTSTIQVTMDGNKRVVPILHPAGYDELPQMSSADYPVVAYGENVVIRGSNLASAKTASLLYLEHKYDRPAVNQTDNSFEFQMSSVFYSKNSAHNIFLEEAGGATIGIPIYNEHTQEGQTPLSAYFTPMVVRAGAILSGYTRSELIVVESGGILRVDNSMVQLKHIIAEDGAVVDFTTATSLNDVQYFYSPKTLTLGALPADTSSKLYGSIRPSYGMSKITLGYKINVQVDGPGSVKIDPEQPAFANNSIVNLEAIPDAGTYFIRWTGDFSGIDATSEFRVTGDASVTAEFSTASNYFSVWRLEHFTNEELEDISISAFDADPDHDSLSNSAEYAFGSDPRSADKKHKIKVDKQQIDGEFVFTVSYPRPKDALDVSYQILVSKDLVTWNFNGDDTDLVYSEEISVESIDEETEEVTSILYPNNDSPRSFFVKISALLFE
ncbi:InlB B-repeat-containing protein [Coraliomargarita parva]|uniref:InlB B-repeat-containing protein n=1 Tax=Coraliomargarita parva TaxID=3014050 RepID=UPI0022B36B40|nr:InlB B-repeat-containing protein [Coraliomargarita parva]